MVGVSVTVDGSLTVTLPRSFTVTFHKSSPWSHEKNYKAMWVGGGGGFPSHITSLTEGRLLRGGALLHHAISLLQRQTSQNVAILFSLNMINDVSVSVMNYLIALTSICGLERNETIRLRCVFSLLHVISFFQFHQAAREKHKHRIHTDHFDSKICTANVNACI